MPTALYGRGKPPAISHPPNLAAARFAVVRFAAHVTESNISDRTSFLLSIRLSGFRPPQTEFRTHWVLFTKFLFIS